MRAAVISDVHANLHALDAVLERIDEERVDALFVLGDMVGYGGAPADVLARLRARPDALLIAGNHDLAAVGRFETVWFNPVARAAIEWTSSVLDEDGRALLSTLEPSATTEGAMLVHGSVVDPAAEYVVSADAAARSFDAAGFSRCFFGHTHIPMAFLRDELGRIESRPLADGELISLPSSGRVMLNPGSVGQPRDSDPRASFMIVDDEAKNVVVHRVAYDIAGAQAQIRGAGLPDVLADRLAAGR